MSGRAASALAVALVAWIAVPSCTTGNTATLDLFPPPGEAGGAGSCSIQSCGAGGYEAAPATAGGAGGVAAGGGGGVAAGGAGGVAAGGAAGGGAGGQAGGAGGAVTFDAGHDGDDHCDGPGDCLDDSKRICSNGRCVECGEDRDCTDPGKPGCLTTTGRCEDCSSDLHCANGEHCDLSEGKCR